MKTKTTFRSAGCFAAWLGIAFRLGSGAAAAPAPPAAPSPSGFNLARLSLLGDPQYSAARKAQLGLSFLREESAHPTPIPRPAYSSFKTHDYVLARISRKLAKVQPDRTALKRAWETEKPGEVKDCLAVCLLALEEKSMREPVTKYLLDLKTLGRVREFAAETLGEFALREDEDEIGETLAKVLRQDAYSSYKLAEKPRPGEEPRYILTFPVKRAAAVEIRKMADRGMLLPSYVTAAAQGTFEFPIPPAPASSSAPRRPGN